MKKLYSYITLSCALFYSIGMYAQGAGQAMDFSSPEQVTIPNTSALNPTTAITLEAWINADTWGPNPWSSSIIGKDSWSTSSGESGYTLRCGANGTLSFNFGVNPTWREATSPATMSTGKWYHVAGTYNGSLLTVYINGEIVGTQSYVGTIAPNTNQLLLGNLPETSQNRYFDGKIDEVRVWNVARTQAELRANMCKKLAGTEAGLVAYYRMDELTGTAVIDATPNANNGTTNSFVPVRDFSNAPIGDESDYLYTNSWSGQSVSLSHPDGDSITVSSIVGSPSYVHVYRVDDTPNDSVGPNDLKELETARYWGVYAGDISAVNYTVSYNYNGFPGITSPNSLDFGYRPNVNTPWAKAGTTLDVPTTTLTKTNQAEGQYILGDTVNNSPLALYNLIDPVDNATITMQGKNGNQNLIFKWHSSSLPGGGSVTYTWMLDSIGKDFSAPLISIQSNSLGTDTALTNNYLFYRNVLKNLGVQNGQSATFKWTVEATSGPEKRRATSSHVITFVQGSFIGIDENEAEKRFKVYPNPAKDVIMLQNVSINDEEINVQIVSITGQVLYAQAFNINGVEEQGISVSGIAKGMYLLKVSRDGVEEVHRIMIE